MTVDLTSNDATGYLSYSGFQSETVEPNTGAPGSKPFEYPYYPDGGVFVMVVAEPLSAASTYAEESTFIVAGKTVTDSDFALHEIGSITYDDALVTSSGQTTLSPSFFTLQLSDADFSPLGTPRDIDNEFAWTYPLSVTNITGTGLTFQDGVLVSIDLVADVQVDVWLLDNPGLAFDPGFAAPSGISFSGSTFVYAIDETTPQTTFFGQLDSNRMVVTRSGTWTAEAPPPVPIGRAPWLLVAALITLAVRALSRMPRTQPER